MSYLPSRRLRQSIAGTLLITGALIVLLSGCATSSGSTYHSVVAAETAQKSNAARDASGGSTAGSGRSGSDQSQSGTVTTSPAPDSNAGGDGDVTISTTQSSQSGTATNNSTQTSTLVVNSDPGSANVFVNGVLEGVTPLTLSGLNAGRYRIEIQKSGYYGVSRRVDIDPGSTVEMSAQLQLVTGFLSVRSTPENSEVYVDGGEVSSPVIQLPVGIHSVRVRSFGYEEQSQVVTVLENTTTTVVFVLQTAPFDATDFGVNRPLFSPYNVGPVGSTRISFSVTAPGSGNVQVTDSTGAVVRKLPAMQFSTWDQSVRWDGRDGSGKIVPNGRYTITLRASSVDGKVTLARETTADVDSSLRVSYESLWSGVSGLSYAATADVLPLNGIELATLFAGHIDTPASGNTARFPISVGLRYGLPASTEVDVAAHATVNAVAALNDFGATLSGKWRWIDSVAGNTSLQGSVVVTGSLFSGLRTDTFTAFNGVGLGVPLTMRFGALGMSLGPELYVSNETASYSATDSSVNGIYFWGYGRAGLFFDSGATFAGVSAAVRTPAFAGTSSANEMRTASFPLYGPLEIAAELHTVIPGTSVFASILGIADVTSMSDYYISLGGGVGFLY